MCSSSAADVRRASVRYNHNMSASADASFAEISVYCSRHTPYAVLPEVAAFARTRRRVMILRTLASAATVKTTAHGVCLLL